MRAALRSRLERLEVIVEPKKPDFFRTGYLKTLPADYVGERHRVIVKREPSGNGEWREFEERYRDIYRVSGRWNPQSGSPGRDENRCFTD
jgi:hypothetical protein